MEKIIEIVHDPDEKRDCGGDCIFYDENTISCIMDFGTDGSTVGCPGPGKHRMTLEDENQYKKRIDYLKKLLNGIMRSKWRNTIRGKTALIAKYLGIEILDWHEVKTKTFEDYDDEISDRRKVIEALWDEVNGSNNYCNAEQSKRIGDIICDSETLEQFTEKLLEGKDDPD